MLFEVLLELISGHCEFETNVQERLKFKKYFLNHEVRPIQEQLLFETVHYWLGYGNIFEIFDASV